MKKLTGILFLSMFVLAILAGCKKDKEPDPGNNNNNNNNNNNTTVKQSDQEGTSAADAAIDDVNDFVNNKIGGGSNMRVSSYNLPCGVVSVDSSTTNSNGKTIYKFQYGNQTTCGYKRKSGQITFELKSGINFGEAGAVISLTFIDYVVEILATGRTVKLNGTIEITNVDGGYIWQAVVNGSTIRRRIKGSFDITFANNEVRHRKYYQLRTWASPSPNNWEDFSLTVDGDTLIDGKTVSEIGKTYEGNYDFHKEIMEPLFWENCGTTWAGPYVLQQGQARMHVSIPLVTPAYIEVQAGYKYNTNDNTGTLVNNCESNSYKITTVLGTLTSSLYQLY